MPSIQKLLQILRSLMEDEPPQRSTRRNRRSDSSRNSFRNRQAVALVITFRDLFANGGLNLILDDIDASRRPPKKNRANSRSTSVVLPNTSNEVSIVPAVSSTRILNLTSDDQTRLPSLRCTMDDEITPLLMEESQPPVNWCSNPKPTIPLPLVPMNQLQRFSFSERWNREQTDFTVSLFPNDEKKTVNTLRKVLKWSPRKQNSASFAVTVPKEEEYKAVAVVQNAVNRVKEEQERKKKRKFFRFTFC
ncbi:uncharacterized protein LOC129216448 [Uloborus diversus]|uniref:uncharacterized protein LOC129216448 n=1 Tax=Uloborus diversus TaxID=327109 RepID=UPI0024092B05|nr:uncharacterized protein LOC129216448 [Uloborus diversus]